MVSLHWSMIALQFLTTLSNVHTAALPGSDGLDSINVVEKALGAGVLDLRSEAHVTATALVGYPHGKDFSDVSAIGAVHRRMAAIGLACKVDEHVTGMTVSWQNNQVAVPSVEVTSIHGKSNIGQDYTSLDLTSGEFVTVVELSTWRAKVRKGGRTVRRTRIGYLKFTTNKGNSIECGAKSSSDPSFTWGNCKMALLYLSGSSGDAIDALQGHFIPSADY